MLTHSQFVAWLQSRRGAGESHKAIGASLGVSHEAVRGWLAGRINASATVLLLAEFLLREPVELAAGSPIRGDSSDPG